ncbi:unnamed protein product, partial [Medioppia subpectinata]
NDLSLLFTHLDEDGDGEININELWKHSGIYKPEDSACLLTELLLHEDTNHDENLDFSEFQNAFNKLYTNDLSLLFTHLDEDGDGEININELWKHSGIYKSLAVNVVEAHVGDNVEIRCDIMGEPQPPAIKWTRFNVDLNTVNIPNMKVFSDGSLYLTNVQLSFSGNYTCQAVNNPLVKQVHILHTIVPPLVSVSPRFQWEPIGGLATIDCRYESFEDTVSIEWYKNEELLLGTNARTVIMNNATKVQIGQLTRTDTGAYSCRVTDKRPADTPNGPTGTQSSGQDVSSLLIQDDAVQVSADAADESREKLWVFHGNGVSIYAGGCQGLIHELDGRDIIPQSGLTLCGATDTDQRVICEWSDNALVADGRVYVAQPNLNRLVVFHGQQLNVVQVIATDPQPRRLWSVRSNTATTGSAGTDEHQIWVLCAGNNPTIKAADGGSSAASDESSESGESAGADTFGEFEWGREAGRASGGRPGMGAADSAEFEWQYPSRQQQRRNRKTVQVVRLSASVHQPNVIHLQPIDGHFDLVYDMFVPEFSPQRLHLKHGITNRLVIM